MSAHKTNRKAARACQVLPLAREAAKIITAMNAIDARENTRPMDDFHAGALRERLEAIKFAASYLVPRSAAGAAFQIAMGGAEADLIFHSTFASEHEKARYQDLASRLLANARRFHDAEAFEIIGPASHGLFQYFCNPDMDPDRLLAAALAQ